MPVSVRGTDILFNDSTTQSTAFTTAAAWPGVYTGTDVNNTSFPIGSYIAVPSGYTTGINNNTTKAIFSAFSTFVFFSTSWPLAGTWRSRGSLSFAGACCTPSGGLFQRVA